VFGEAPERCLSRDEVSTHVPFHRRHYETEELETVQCLVRGIDRDTHFPRELAHGHWDLSVVVAAIATLDPGVGITSVGP
jgi:hypothetical protein